MKHEKKRIYFGQKGRNVVAVRPHGKCAAYFLWVLVGCSCSETGIEGDAIEDQSDWDIITVDNEMEIADTVHWDTIYDLGEDVSDDSEEGINTDIEEDMGPCTYPSGPYEFNAVGDLVGPATWPGSIKGTDEISILLHADLCAFYCDPNIQSILVFLAAQSAPTGPSRIAEMVSHKSEFETYGAKWIWILASEGGTEPTTAMAQSYYSGNGVDFGWFTNDQDNSWQPYSFHNTHMAVLGGGSGVPWIGVIDAKTMRVVASNPSDVMAMIMALASD